MTSILEFATNKLLLAILDGTDLMIVHEWKKVMLIKEPSLANNEKYWLAPLPGFNVDKFPFCITHGR